MNAELKAVEEIASSPAGIAAILGCLWVGNEWLKTLRKEDKANTESEIKDIKDRMSKYESTSRQDIRDHQTSCGLKNDVEYLKTSLRDHKLDIQRVYQKIEEIKDLIIQSLRDKNKE